MSRAINLRSALFLAGLLLAVVAIAGCGHSTAPPSTPTAGPQGTPVPTKLTNYASVALFSLRQSVDAGHSVLRTMERSTKPHSTTIQTVGNDCSDAGGTVASARETFLGTPPPPQAHATYEKAHVGFHYTLSSLDECGVASDAADSHLMRTAIADLKRALSQLSSAKSTVSTWDRANSSSASSG